jgi:hypothetical protein
LTTSGLSVSEGTVASPSNQNAIRPSRDEGDARMADR